MAITGTFAAQVTPDGIIVPPYSDVLQQLKSAYWSIYGSDSDLSENTMDGQFLAVLAQGISDCNQVAAAVYNAFSPATAQGVGLSSVVKINGLRRQDSSKSTVEVLLVGQVGITIENGIVGDNLGQQTQWALPAIVVIPDAGQITVTATCTQEGAVTAAADSITQIITPTRGWQTVNNPDSAAPGNPIEIDATLRRRQSQSTSIGAMSVIESIFAAVANIAGVTRLQIYENDSDATDGDGIPSHSIAVVVLGGDADTIAETIALKKTPGTGTAGDTAIMVEDTRGVPSTIRYYPLNLVPLTLDIDVDAMAGYSTAVGVQIATATAAFINAYDIGEDSYLSRLYAAAALIGTPYENTFVVTAIRQSRDGVPPAAATVPISFREAATCTVDAVTIHAV